MSSFHSDVKFQECYSIVVCILSFTIVFLNSSCYGNISLKESSILFIIHCNKIAYKSLQMPKTSLSMMIQYFLFFLSIQTSNEIILTRKECGRIWFHWKNNNLAKDFRANLKDEVFKKIFYSEFNRSQTIPLHVAIILYAVCRVI